MGPMGPTGPMGRGDGAQSQGVQEWSSSFARAFSEITLRVGTAASFFWLARVRPSWFLLSTLPAALTRTFRKEPEPYVRLVMRNVRAAISIRAFFDPADQDISR